MIFDSSSVCECVQHFVAKKRRLTAEARRKTSCSREGGKKYVSRWEFAEKDQKVSAGWLFQSSTREEIYEQDVKCVGIFPLLCTWQRGLLRITGASHTLNYLQLLSPINHRNEGQNSIAWFLLLFWKLYHKKTNQKHLLVDGWVSLQSTGLSSSTILLLYPHSMSHSAPVSTKWS